ncbi:hypothetical protein [Cyclobacterium plantarum]|uniref:hypothetical protein n=1 Tax=Cyclobacterium plantarum TaxID=2716263 RepID=UPI001C9E2606|nr:hypothetical protein [Cyclobacterium plantarum]
MKKQKRFVVRHSCIGVKQTTILTNPSERIVVQKAEINAKLEIKHGASDTEREDYAICRVLPNQFQEN